ncbi:hypothetical protein STENM327S_01244 [Streptomyces tendae]
MHETPPEPNEREKLVTSENSGREQDGATEAFVAHRNLLFTVAYKMLGSAADAEDVLQETWLKWAGSTSTRCATAAPTWCASPPARP